MIVRADSTTPRCCDCSYAAMSESIWTGELCAFCMLFEGLVSGEPAICYECRSTESLCGLKGRYFTKDIGGA